MFQATAGVVERPVERCLPSRPEARHGLVGLLVSLVILLVIPSCRNSAGQERTLWTTPLT
jgi:hypothetical protein